MADLIDKYFREDLSEAEEQGLSDLLASSDEAAQRFSTLAEGKYRSYGLPEPVLPRSGGMGDFLREHGRLLLLLLAFGALFGAAIWVVCSALRTTCPAETPVVAPAPAPPAPEVIQPVRKAVKVRSLAAPPRPVMDSHKPAQGKGLQIVFKMLVAGRASIRVFDPQGREVRTLFDGPMNAGSWTVPWDGLFADGRPAPGGLYKVEVTTNGVTKMRDVRIK